MALKKFRPTTPTLRHTEVPDFAEITRGRPLKALTKRLSRTGGRDNYGHISSRWIGGGGPRPQRGDVLPTHGQGGQLCPAAAALGRGTTVPRGLPRRDRTGGESGARERVVRQGGSDALAGTQPIRARRGDESRRPSHGRRRRQ